MMSIQLSSKAEFSVAKPFTLTTAGERWEWKWPHWPSLNRGVYGHNSLWTTFTLCNDRSLWPIAALFKWPQRAVRRRSGWSNGLKGFYEIARFCQFFFYPFFRSQFLVIFKALRVGHHRDCSTRQSCPWCTQAQGLLGFFGLLGARLWGIFQLSMQKKIWLPQHWWKLQIFRTDQNNLYLLSLMRSYNKKRGTII